MLETTPAVFPAGGWCLSYLPDWPFWWWFSGLVLAGATVPVIQKMRQEN